MSHRLTGLALLAALCAAPLAAAPIPPTKAEIARNARNATALIIDDRGASGTGFCVEAGGYFVTNEHVVSGGNKLQLVLNPSEKTEKVYPVKVVRIDRERDLALVRVEGAKDLPALTVAPADKLEALDEVYVFGFPFGKALGEKNEYPSISNSTCQVGSLRLKQGELQRIDLNGTINPGNSGGPVVNAAGQVVGVVVSGIRGAGLSQAIPAAHVRAFLNSPAFELTLPDVAGAKAGQEAAFGVRLVSPLAPVQGIDVDMVLTVGGFERRIAMTRGAEGVYTANAVVRPAKAGAAVRVRVTYADGASVVAEVAESALKVGGSPKTFADLKWVEVAPKLKAADSVGRELPGAVEGLASVKLMLGKPAALDLASAQRIDVLPQAVSGTATVAFVALRDGAEVGRRAANLYGKPTETTLVSGTPGTPGTPPDTGRPAPKTPPAAAPEEAPVTVKLPGAFAQVTMGGAGKYLLFNTPSLKRVVVFDIAAAKIKGYVELLEDTALVAGGRDKFVIAYPGKNLITRYTYDKMEKETSLAGPTGESLKAITMGHGGTGPILVLSTAPAPNNQTRVNERFYDLSTLRPYDVKVDAAGNVRPLIDTAVLYRASGDGKVFTRWGTTGSAFGVTVMRVEGKSIKYAHENEAAGHLSPDFDGKTIYSGRGRVKLDATFVDKADTIYTVPAVRGGFFLRVSSPYTDPSLPEKINLDLYGEGERKATVRLGTYEGYRVARLSDRETVGLDQRIYLAPELKTLALLPETNDRVELRPFDIVAAFEKAGAEYLVVTSFAPPTTKRGANWTYTPQAKSHKGDEVTFKINAGPPGMKIDDMGVLTWAVPTNAPLGDVRVILDVSDKSGQSIFHTFGVRIE